MNVQGNQSVSFGAVDLCVAKGVCPRRVAVGENIARTLRQKSSGLVDYTVAIRKNSLSIGDSFTITGSKAKDSGFVERQFNQKFVMA